MKQVNKKDNASDLNQIEIISNNSDLKMANKNDSDLEQTEIMINSSDLEQAQ